MESSSSPSTLPWSTRHPVAKIVLYYLALALGIALLYQVAPDLQGVFSMTRFNTVAGAAAGAGKAFAGKGGMFNTAGATTDTVAATGAHAAVLTPAVVAEESLIAMVIAVLLMLPVTWVFILTRSRKGFSQSTAQTLIFLPIVVAGVIMLVQFSVALAFGLGGVVGAVSFRNRLDDPKDAIYIFVAIAVGLSAGVQVAAAALAISMFFNFVVLVAWKADFGRMPAQLEASVASKRLERVKAAGGGSKEFMNLVDNQLLKSMTPDMLEALSKRAAERGKKAAADIGLVSDEEGDDEAAEEKKPQKLDSLLRVYMQPDDAAAVRSAIEAVLESQVKRWEFEKAGAGEGGRAMAQYKLRFKKSNPSTLVVEAMRRSVLPRVVTIDVRDA